MNMVKVRLCVCVGGGRWAVGRGLTSSKCHKEMYNIIGEYHI